MTTIQADFQSLRHISINAVTQLPPTTPTQKIRTDADLETWRTTTGYRDYAVFLRQLNESVVGYYLPWSSSSPREATISTLSLLDVLDHWIDEIPPQSTPQRFGNLAFRTWGKRLEDEHDRLLASLLPAHMHAVVPYLAPYLLRSFGSFTRMDYGTGHETSFALFLLCLTLIRFFEPEPETEREIVLMIFARYLRLCWRLQDVYKLEPAGSHGVWGLDDYSFLSYIFGSAQLRDQTDIPVSAIIHPPLPPTNLYFLSISRILEVKQGPFFEHSSQLYSIATGVQHWSKVNSGLLKMYDAEVLGKRVVVQHLPLGGLLKWDPPTTPILPESTHNVSADMPPLPSRTMAPWAMSKIPSTAVSSPPPGSFPTSTVLRSDCTHSLSSQSSADHMQKHPRSLNAAPLSGRRAGPITTNKLPLGPLASTSLRPTAFAAGNKSMTPGPTAPNTPPSSGHDEEGGE
ncbi:hypothetical protein BDY19DRAFT_939099 [Irpex rosettiformis]|uniref:Uncharacterized protein n=1 Tax=Irpex rosettiformis TaxID=378272 RepID=A0ACB8U7A3_9APHY|nr:hypothetical protein BDY19DRAFT_939099 [Irpex rosettiformis]